MGTEIIGWKNILSIVLYCDIQVLVYVVQNMG